jgi:hypothetical protein
VSGTAGERRGRAAGASDSQGARRGGKGQRRGKRDRREAATASGADEGARASASEAADAMAAAAPDLPDNANPDTVPFTGLRLGVLVALGLAVLAVGVAMRRGVGRPRPRQVATGAE